MYFKSLELWDFRNYSHLFLEFDKGINLITGENAQGKTNLIEALYIMAFGKSFRTQRDDRLIRFGSRYARAKSVSVRDGCEQTIELGFIEKKKSIKIDGSAVKRTAELLQNVFIVMFSPEDLRIVKDEPEKRRKFMDRELCQLKPVYFSNMAKYKKALKQRNALLKRESPNVNTELLSVFDEELVHYGSLIMRDRKSFTDDLGKVCSEIHSRLTAGRESFKIIYEPDIPAAGTVKEQAEFFREKLRKNLSNDIGRRSTLEGPHRDDLKIEIDGTDVRYYGSQGQQRSSALSLKLAEIYLIKKETGHYPVLLLDDVLSELDNTRQNRLISSFEDMQIFITAADPGRELLSGLPPYTLYEVRNGEVNLCPIQK